MIRELEEVQEKYIEKYTEQLFIEDYQMELLSLSGLLQSTEDEAEGIFLVSYSLMNLSWRKSKC